MLPLTLRRPRAMRPLRRSGAYPRRFDKPRPADLTPHASGADPLFAVSRDALVLVDLASDTIVRWNPAAEALFGYSPAEAVGKTVDLLMPPAVARLHRERVAHYRRTGEVDILAPRGPIAMPALARSGRELRVELSTAPVDLPGSAARLLLLTMRDATCAQRADRLALEAARSESARSEVEIRLSNCEELLDATTRDLAKPIARARRTSARLARFTANESGHTVEGDARLRRLAQLVEGRTEDLQRSLTEIADATAIQTGKFALEPERVNLVPLIRGLVATLRTRTSGMQRLKLGGPQGLTATCDPRRVTSVIEHIIERAGRRNPRGCWIDVDLRRPLAGMARIEVRDYGRRLSERERHLLSPIGADRGWLVDRYIVEQHGGTLAFELPPEGGLRVIVNLPTHRARAGS